MEQEMDTGMSGFRGNLGFWVGVLVRCKVSCILRLKKGAMGYYLSIMRLFQL